MTGAIKVQLAPSPPELVVEVAPLSVEEGFPDMLEVQSPTLIIQGVLGELALKEEAIEAHGIVEEEEGSSSTPDKEDTEDERATNEAEIPMSEPKFFLLSSKIKIQ